MDIYLYIVTIKAGYCWKNNNTSTNTSTNTNTNTDTNTSFDILACWTANFVKNTALAFSTLQTL